MIKHEVHGPFNQCEIEKIYDELMRSNYYDASYNSDWIPEPYRLMANVLGFVFQRELQENPRIVDLGCGVGYLLHFLRLNNFDASGIEFSEGMYARIEATDRKHVQLVDGPSFFSEDRFRGAKLVVSLEVFEHLPLSLLEKNLLKLSNELDGFLFLTIPSSGTDPRTGRRGFTEASVDRLADMRKNRPFSHMAMIDGKPGGGHITLASYRWWTDFFLLNGFIRTYMFEESLNKFDNIFEAYRWCPYVLQKADTESIHFSFGWKPSNDGSTAMLMVGGDSHIEIITAGCCELYLFFDETDANRNLDTRLFWSVIELNMDRNSGVIDYREVAKGLYTSGAEPDRKALVIPICSSGPSDRPLGHYRVQFLYPTAKVLSDIFSSDAGGMVCYRANLIPIT
jgi:SAM-dependent methyltransferase